MISKNPYVYLILTIAVPAWLYAGSALAETVHFRKSCNEGESTIPNCYEPANFGEMLTWIRNTRKPNADSPLTIEIGEGRFAIDEFPEDAQVGFRLRCDASTGFTGHITIKGASRTSTIIGNNTGYTLTVNSCEGMVFKDLQIGAYGVSGGAISWRGGGSSAWENVDVESQYYSWVSRKEGCGTSRGKHYWFNSRIRNVDAFSAAVNYIEECDESWFFSSEIMNTANQLSVNPTVFSISNVGEVHVYGSVIRSLASAQLAPGRHISAVRIADGGDIHIHGTGIDVISPFDNNIIALDVGENAEVHIVESSYNLSTGTGGTITRIVNNGGHVHAPYTWPSHAEPPPIVSMTGADMAIVTNTDNGHPHIVIYDSSCPSAWFDSTINACR